MTDSPANPDHPDSSPPPSDAADPSSGGEPPRKRRRRRRRGKPVAGETPREPSAADPEPAITAKGDSPPTTGDAARPSKKPRETTAPSSAGRSSGGYRGKSPDKTKPRREAGAARTQASAPPPREEKPSAKGPKPKKRRKLRTKQCVNCFTPCTTIHRVRLDHRRQWHFICDICWPSRCIDNPHYEFGGTWVTGRIIKPESQIRDERRAAQATPPA
jgi:hypothetical protein